MTGLPISTTSTSRGARITATPSSDLRNSVTAWLRQVGVLVCRNHRYVLSPGLEPVSYMSKRQSSASAVKEVASTEEQQLPLSNNRWKLPNALQKLQMLKLLPPWQRTRSWLIPPDQPEATEVVHQLAQRKLRGQQHHRGAGQSLHRHHRP